MRVPFPALSGKNSRCSLCISRGGALHRKVERNPKGPATTPKVPQISPSTPKEQDLPELPQHSCRVSTQTSVAHMRALWESLLGKPRRKATDPSINETGSLTLMLQVRGKFDVLSPRKTRTNTPVETLEVPTSSMSALERNPQFQPRLNTSSKALAPTIDETLEFIATRIETGLS